MAVTVAAAEATGAEVLAKAALLTGTVATAVDLLESAGVAGWLSAATGDPVLVGGFERLCWTMDTAA